MSEDMAFVLFPDFFHVRCYSILEAIGSAHRLRKIVPMVGLSVVSPEYPDSEFNLGRRTTWGHLVARHRGTVLFAVALGRAILLFHTNPSDRHRRNLPLSRAAFLLVIAPRLSLHKCILPP